MEEVDGLNYLLDNFRRAVAAHDHRGVLLSLQTQDAPVTFKVSMVQGLL
jgi:hypothetical protein